MEEEEVVEEEMQQVAAVSEDGETFYVQLPKSVQIGANNIVTSETNEDGHQVLRIVEVNPDQEGGAIGLQAANEDIINPEAVEDLAEIPQEMEIEQSTALSGQEMKVMDVETSETGQLQIPDGSHNLELFQHAMALLQKKTNNTATTIVTGPESGETVYIVHDSGENISMETAEVALHQADGTQIMVLAPPDESSSAAKEASEAATSSQTGSEIKENVISEEIQTAVSEITDPAQADQVKIIKRKRGRPKKVKPPVSSEERFEKVAPADHVSKISERPIETSAGGRPRRRAAQKLLENWKAMNMTAEQDIEENVSPPPSPLPMSKPELPKLPLFRENKENLAPAKQSNHKLRPEKDAIKVNIAISDKTALQVIDDIGIHMLYYCRRCTFFSKRLQALANHVVECRLRELTDAEKRKAEDACLTNAILSSAALKGIASTDLSAIKNASADCITIDEHNYAEVDLVEAPVGKEEPTKEIAEVPELPEELRPRKWFCLDCPDVIYGEKDLEIHRKCHGVNGLDPLHCYMCAEEKGKVPASRYDWKEVRKHLRHYHDVDFEMACLHCNEVYPDHASYNTHVRTHGQKCDSPNCDFVTDSLEVLNMHQNSHVDGSDTFSCCLCQENSPDWLSLRDHIVRSHPMVINVLYSCTECDEPFQEQQAFQEHMSRNTTTGKLGCHLCTETFYLCAMPSHLRLVHSDVDGEEAARVIESAASQCPLEEETKEKEMVEMELSQPEAETEIETAVIESASQAQKGMEQNENPSMDSYLENRHDEVTKQIDIKEQTTEGATSQTSMLNAKKYRCHQHELVFFSQADLTKHHMEVHWGVTKEKVAQVEEERRKERESKAAAPVPVKRGRGRPRKIRNTEYVDDDMKDPEFRVAGFPSSRRIRQGGYKSSRCKYCYKTFTSQDSLSRHVNRCHTPDKMKPVECRICGKFYRNGIQLRNHVRVVHEGIKRAYVYKKKYVSKKKTFMCETCGYTTPELNRLTNHKMSVHEGHYPFQCALCDYKTNERADMKRHEHKHQGVKRYSCQYCTYKSDQRWLLVNHCNRQHNIQLNKLSRNTRGTYWSNRKKRREEGEMAEGAGAAPLETLVVENDNNSQFTQEIVIGGGVHQLGDGYFVPMVTTNEHGEEAVTMIAVGGEGSGMQPHEVAVETVEEETKPGEVVYIQEDGTIIDPEEAAIMLVAVGPEGTQATEQVEVNYT